MASEFKVNNFDLLRIAAATQVVLVHSVAHLGLGRPPFWSVLDAFPGVPIFFAISGFLISASFERAPDLLSYTRNRLLRIIPALWCVVFLTIPVAALFGFDFLSARGLFWLVCQMVGLIYTPGFLDDFGFGSYNGALWTIPIELQFYFVMPLLYLGRAWSAKHRDLLIVGAWVVFVAIAYVYAMAVAPLAEDVVEPLPQKLFRYSFIPHIYMFLTGLLLQRWQAHRSRWIAGKGFHWLAAYLAFHFTVPGGAFNHVVGSLMMAISTVALAYTVPSLSRRLLRGNDISYGVYIYHGLILNILIESGRRGNALDVPLVVVLTFVAGALSWRLVERPFLRRKRVTIHSVAAAG